MKIRLSTWGAVVFAGSVLGSLAEVPKIDGIFPAGGQRGTEFEVTVTGTFKPWPLQALCDDERIAFSPHEKNEGTYRVVIPAEVEPGGCLVRFFNKEGASAPRQFVVGALPERTQGGSETMIVPVEEFPLTVNGKLESGGQVDRFSVVLAAGQVVVADVTAYAIDSPLDPLLHVRGPRGEQLAFNHDATRTGLDPRLVFTAPADGTFELQLSAFAYPPKADIKFTGGASSIYRLTLGSEHPVLALPPPHEAEGEEAQRIDLPVSVSGTIAPPGEVDRFLVTAKKGETIRCEVAAAEFGSWMDPVLVIRDATGKELKRQDDIDSKTQHDVALDWTAPADGEFTVEITDLNRNGGSEIAYQLRATRPDPGFIATAVGGVFRIAPGKKLEIDVKVARRYGYKGDLEAGCEGLPAGVTAVPVAVSEKGEAKLVLEAVDEAAPANGPFTIWAGPKDAAERRVPCSFDLKGINADAGDMLTNRTGRGWLTVLEKK